MPQPRSCPIGAVSGLWRQAWLTALALLASRAALAGCTPTLLHSAIDHTHTFQIKLQCDGSYRPLVYQLKAIQQHDGVTETNSESGQLDLHNGETPILGDVDVTLTPGDSVHVVATITQACEVLGKSTLDYQENGQQDESAPTPANPATGAP
ncbi:MAG: hypothetical protein R3292_09700 [Alcanivorax sp.]|nr:hypothetical protein [Alcanivorax sp.]